MLFIEKTEYKNLVKQFLGLNKPHGADGYGVEGSKNKPHGADGYKNIFRVKSDDAVFFLRD